MFHSSCRGRDPWFALRLSFMISFTPKVLLPLSARGPLYEGVLGNAGKKHFPVFETLQPFAGSLPQGFERSSGMVRFIVPMSPFPSVQAVRPCHVLEPIVCCYPLASYRRRVGPQYTPYGRNLLGTAPPATHLRHPLVAKFFSPTS